MVLCVMNAIDNRKVLTVDIPDAFIQVDRSQDKHHGYIMFEITMTDVICKNNTAFHNMIIWSKDNKINKKIHTTNTTNTNTTTKTPSPMTITAKHYNPTEAAELAPTLFTVTELLDEDTLDYVYGIFQRILIMTVQ